MSLIYCLCAVLVPSKQKQEKLNIPRRAIRIMRSLKLLLYEKWFSNPAPVSLERLKKT